MYDRIGKAAMKFTFRYVRRRYRREGRIALGLALLAAFIGAYLATREVPEG
jgi:hypothetical protein